MSCSVLTPNGTAYRGKLAHVRFDGQKEATPHPLQVLKAADDTKGIARLVRCASSAPTM
jgi:hypothetical protein